MDNELILFDRIEVIKLMINKYGADNFYLSFSGGKDSTVLHYLLDMAIPNNNIPRVYSDTGIEFDMIKDFVNELKETDSRIVIVKPTAPLGKVFKNYGYPFKSKAHSEYVWRYQNRGMRTHLERYLNPPKNRIRFSCPNCLKYQFTNDFNLKVSSQCCNALKKSVFAEYQKANDKPYVLTGERIAEGGARSQHKDCLVVDRNGNLKKFKPLNKVNNEWMEWFIDTYKIKLCKLYYPPYNFERTGCVGCPYNIHLAKELETLYTLLPKEYKKAKALWKPVYDEYIRIKYRLIKYPNEERQLSLFEEKERN